MSNDYPVSGAAQGPPGDPSGVPPTYGRPQQTSPLAIVSLVLGILGLPCCMFFVLGIAAVVTGLVSRKQIRDSQGRLKGDGMALGGIVLGVVALMFALVYTILRVTGVEESNLAIDTAP